MKQRIFIGVFVMMLIAGLSIHLLVGRKAFNPLFKEVTQRRVQTVALLASTIEESPTPRRTVRDLEKRLGLEIRLSDRVPERFAEKGRTFEVDQYQVKAMRFPKAPLVTEITLRGEPRFLLVRFPIDIEDIKRRRGLDFLKIIVVLMVFAGIISRWAFSPLQKATLAMGQIAEGNLEHRVVDNIGSAKDAFNQMADRVVEMLDGQQLLLASISHELRTPLARMRLATALLESKVDTKALDEEIEEMDALVEMLLLSSQLQSGSFETKLVEMDPQSLILDLLADIDLADRYVDLQITNDLAIYGDRLLLRRVIWNLLSNIVKYTPLDCTVQIITKKENDGVVVEVADTGKGVSDASLAQMLEPFWRHDRSRNKSEQGGWGLGLSFVHRAIEAHGGTVVLAHNQPTGLRVRLFLPHQKQSVGSASSVGDDRT